ncbi:MAG TPA: hypothetical protein VEA35_06840 [Ramlibacter sp.]|nr:hypothetical protein [Candidatus Limnocylindrales bacterium]HYF42152.1 hypothetical protein [Ramlibacter sp.]
MADLLLSPDEIAAVCGGYVQPAKQLQELHRQGFFRARRSTVTGAVILERAHYEAVCAGATKPANDLKAARPRVRA